LTQVDFAVVWRYFAWTNQTLAAIVLWTITAYLIKERKQYWITLIPSAFMTAVVVSYLLLAPEGFQLPVNISYIAGIAVTVGLTILSVSAVYRGRIQDRVLVQK
ncbi:MAG TPA: carbon starvation CstA 5TM domain-containing protein, partial [Cyclobacteriaceae bacterium]